MCGCNNGRLTCTDIDDCRDDDEDRDEDETRCERCQDAPTRLVCGRDRVTYRSLCTAINCSRLRDSDILKDGPCTNQVCNMILLIVLAIHHACTSLSLFLSFSLSLSFFFPFFSLSLALSS